MSSEDSHGMAIVWNWLILSSADGVHR